MRRLSVFLSAAIVSACVSGAVADPSQPPRIITVSGPDAEIVSCTAPHSIFSYSRPGGTDRSVLFQPRKPGDAITFALNADEAIPYDLGTVIWYANDEDVYSISINGRKVNQIDFSTARGSKSTTSQHIVFNAGRNEVTYTYVQPGTLARHGGIRFLRFDLIPSQLMGH